MSTGKKKKKENIPLIDDDDAIDESVPALFTGDLTPNSNKIGRASCRERV